MKKEGWVRDAEAAKAHDGHMSVPPLLSIVTPTLNRLGYLKQAIASVRTQDPALVEHVIVDGGSTDGTLDALRKLGESVTWYSRPGSGISEAVNEGIRGSRGSIIGWLNSDDLYLPGALDRVIQVFAGDPAVDVFYGDSMWIDPSGRYLRTVRGVPYSRFRLVWVSATTFNAQSLFFTRNAWNKIGEFSTDLKCAMDYDWLIRAGQFCKVCYIAGVIGANRRHKDAIQSDGQRIFREVRAISHTHGGRIFTPVMECIAASIIGPAVTNLKRRV